jgi:hypothetical protein
MSTRRQTPTERDLDDEAEIEISPASAAPTNGPPMRPVPIRRRTPNPVADEHIESGEINEPRSRIIRSSGSMPAFEMPQTPQDAFPAPVTNPNLPVAPRRSRMHFLWLIGAIVPVIAVIALTFVDRSPATPEKPSTVGIEAVADMIGTTLDAEANAAYVRVEAIATSSMLRAGIATDANTLADMARDKDLVFPIKAGEVLEVFQIRDGTRKSMLRIPANAPAIKAPLPGSTRIEARDSGVIILANAGMAKQESGIGGEVVLAVPLDLEPIKGRIGDQANQASLMGLEKPVVLVADNGKPGGNIAIAIGTKQKLHDGSISLSVVVPQAAVAASTGSGIEIARFVCLGLAGLLILIFAVSIVRARARN